MNISDMLKLMHQHIAGIYIHIVCRMPLKQAHRKLLYRMGMQGNNETSTVNVDIFAQYIFLRISRRY